MTKTKEEEILTNEGFTDIDIVDGIAVVGIFDWDDIYLADGTEGYSDESMKRFQKWCDKFDAHYYAREKHKFFVWEAVEEAKENNKKIVIIENMS